MAAPSSVAAPDGRAAVRDILPRVSGIDPFLQARLESFLAEDLGRGDATSLAVVPEDARAKGFLLAKSELVISGLDLAGEVFRLLDSDREWAPRAAEGERVPAGANIAAVAGGARALLAGERVALNLVQRMTGIATETRKYVEAVRGTSCRILDTRKTAPGLRTFDKRAVAAGGGTNHRFGLDDGVLIKDNHIALSGGVGAAVSAARERAPFGLRVEVEVEDEAQMRQALSSGADLLLLDNRTPAEVARLVGMARAAAPGVRIEASGSVTLATVRAYAEAGVDFVSVGALTHSVRAGDVSLELEPAR